MQTRSAPQFLVQRSADRYFGNHGWLKTRHSFSFADYYDPQYMNWGALRVFNDDVVDPGQGFGTHPHRDMEIVSYVLSGKLEHRDSLGNHGVVEPGGVQYMSAGTGVRHSEFNGSQTEPVHFVQMWVMPRSMGEPPAYGQADFTQAERTNRWLTIASGEAGVQAPVALRADATMRVARLEDDAALAIDIAPDRFGFLFVADGAVRIDGELLATGDAVRMTGVPHVDLHGSAELVFWDVPAIG
jgi:redox-sensitive bicupin YhaK (pirin superfamily)